MKNNFRRFFLAGIIQGSKKGRNLHNQDYRKKIRFLLKKYFPQARIIDPVKVHPNSAEYASTKGKRVFHRSIEQAKGCDCFIAYLPTASMGTAIEMWECKNKKIPIWTISPLRENWSVKFLSSRVFKNMREFEKFISVIEK
ncbi:MAG: hypothetical protein MUO85_05945 [candidate division Zixibacteria bacterium]|nr:hypothetical protein [candidate division Zixibacteria bacterium]